MLGKKDNNDYFLEFLDGVTPIKKSDKNFKKIKITNITKTKKIVQKSKEKVVSKEKKDLDRNNSYSHLYSWVKRCYKIRKKYPTVNGSGYLYKAC